MSSATLLICFWGKSVSHFRNEASLKFSQIRGSLIRNIYQQPNTLHVWGPDQPCTKIPLKSQNEILVGDRIACHISILIAVVTLISRINVKNNRLFEPRTHIFISKLD